MSYWATKYLYRGETERLDWLVTRYRQTREGFIPDLPDLDEKFSNAEFPQQYVCLVLGGLSEIVPGEQSQRAIQRIRETAKLLSGKRMQNKIITARS